MSYQVKSVFATLQGEGANTGRAAVFCRFARCNLWSGREEHRATAVCRFCDTDFVGTDGPGGGKFPDADALAAAVESTWVGGDDGRFVVCTGGEPLLQLDDGLIEAFHERGFEIAIETNGTIEAPAGIDWVCVSPKAGADWVQVTGNELKLIHPQDGLTPAVVEKRVGLDFDHWLLQPMDGPEIERNTRLVIEHCRANPRWRMSTQVHKYLGIP